MTLKEFKELFKSQKHFYVVVKDSWKFHAEEMYRVEEVKVIEIGYTSTISIYGKESFNFIKLATKSSVLSDTFSRKHKSDYQYTYNREEAELLCEKSIESEVSKERKDFEDKYPNAYYSTLQLNK